MAYLSNPATARKPDSATSSSRAWEEINRLARERYNQAAPQATVEALMFSLRERGTGALEEAATKRRLSLLNETQLRAVCHRVQNFKPEIAPAWTPEEIEALSIIWSELQ